MRCTQHTSHRSEGSHHVAASAGHPSCEQVQGSSECRVSWAGRGSNWLLTGGPTNSSVVTTTSLLSRAPIRLCRVAQPSRQDVCSTGHSSSGHPGRPAPQSAKVCAAAAAAAAIAAASLLQRQEGQTQRRSDMSGISSNLGVYVPLGAGSSQSSGAVTPSKFAGCPVLAIRQYTPKPADCQLPGHHLRVLTRSHALPRLCCLLCPRLPPPRSRCCRRCCCCPCQGRPAQRVLLPLTRRRRQRDEALVHH